MKIRKLNFNRISINSFTFFLLCIYYADLSLKYMDILPAVDSILFSAFLICAGVMILIRQRIMFSPHIAIYGIFTLMCFASCLYSVSVSTSFSTSVTVLKVLVFVLLLYNTLDTNEKIETLFTVYTLANTILFLFLEFTNATGIDDRLGSTLTGNANTFARVYMIGAFWSVYLIMYGSSFNKKIFGIITFFIQEYAIILSESRKNFLAPLILIAILILLISVRKNAKRAFFTAFGIIIGIIFLALLFLKVPFLYNTIGNRFESFFLGIFGLGEIDASSRNRLQMISDSFTVWKSSPIFGCGVNGFRVASGWGTYSHNNFTEVLSGMGIVGFITYYSYPVFALLKLSKNKFEKNPFWVALIISLLVFELGAIGYNLFDVQMVWTMPLCGILAEKTNLENEAAEEISEPEAEEIVSEEAADEG